MNDTKKAMNFLKAFRSKGVINLIAIHPETTQVTGITRPIISDDLSSFIDGHIETHNLYFSVNGPSADAPDTKLKKDNIKSLSGIWLDADPDKNKPFDKERERLFKLADDLKTSTTPPTYIVDSGGGIQAFWLRDEPTSATTDNITLFEGMSRALSEKYNTDKVHNIDRIMRIPFTNNIPTAKKRDRVRCKAKLLYAASKTGIRYTHGDFVKIIEPSTVKEIETTDVNGVELDMNAVKAPVSDSLKAKFKELMGANQKVHDLWHKKIDKPSRSEYDMALTKELKWAGYSLFEVSNILCHFPHGKNKEQTKRELVRTYDRVENPFKGLDPEYIANIEKQTNPLTTETTELIITDDELEKQLKRLKYEVGGDNDGRTSGEPLLKGLIDMNTFTVMYGASNVGKSFVATDVAGHIAAGKNWGQHKLKKQMGVLYVCAEAGGSYGKRLMALKRRLEIEQGTPLTEWPFAFISMGVNFLSNKDDIKDVAVLARILERDSGFKVGMIVVDTLATTFSGGNENSGEDMGVYIDNMKWIQENVVCSVVIVHHSGKDQAAGARGHSSLRAATDTELEVISENINIGEIDGNGGKYRRRIRTRKQRDGESDTEIEFGLQVVDLWDDSDGDPVRTCSVVLEGETEFDSMIASMMDDLSDGEKAVLQAIEVQKEVSNPDIDHLTEHQMLVLIYNDIKSNVGVLVKKSGKLSVSPLKKMEKPSKTIIKAFSRDRDRLVKKGVVNKDV